MRLIESRHAPLSPARSDDQILVLQHVPRSSTLSTRTLKDATDVGGSLLFWYVILFKANDGNSAQVQPTNGRLSAQRPPLLHRSQQSTRITHTHLLPLEQKTQSIPLPNPSSFPTRRSNPMRFQRRPSPDPNIPPAGVHTLSHLWTSPRTNNGDIQDVGWSH